MWCSFDNFENPDEPNNIKDVAKNVAKKLFMEFLPDREFEGSNFTFIQVGLNQV